MSMEAHYELVRKDLRPSETTISTWEGVPLTMFTREELIAIIELSGAELAAERACHSRSLNLLVPRRRP